MHIHFLPYILKERTHLIDLGVDNTVVLKRKVREKCDKWIHLA
jgi:hypothetical protein